MMHLQQTPWDPAARTLSGRGRTASYLLRNLPVFHTGTDSLGQHGFPATGKSYYSETALPSFSQKLAGHPDEYKTCLACRYSSVAGALPGHLDNVHLPPRHPKNLGIILASVLFGKPKGHRSHPLVQDHRRSPLPSSGGHHEGCISR